MTATMQHNNTFTLWAYAKSRCGSSNTEIMKHAFARGCRYANMGGVEGDLSDGLTKFKANFAPYINEFIGEFDLPVNKVLYRFAHSAYQVRKREMIKRNEEIDDED